MIDYYGLLYCTSAVHIEGDALGMWLLGHDDYPTGGDMAVSISNVWSIFRYPSFFKYLRNSCLIVLIKVWLNSEIRSPAL
jgi:hypothetical protein